MSYLQLVPSLFSQPSRLRLSLVVAIILPGLTSGFCGNGGASTSLRLYLKSHHFLSPRKLRVVSRNLNQSFAETYDTPY